MLTLAGALDEEVSRPVAALIGVLVYLAVVALAATLLLESAADRWRDELAGRLAVQLPPVETAQAREAQAERALTALRGLQGVVRAEPVPQERLAALLNPWIGAVAPSQSLPLPVVIDVQLAADADAEMIGRVRASLAAAAPGASVDAGAGALAPALRLMRAIESLSLLLVLVLGGALTGFVFFATRARLAELAETIEVAHLLGAEDTAILDVLTRHALRAALIGGAAGFLPAVLTLLGFGWLAAGGGHLPAELTLAPGAWAAALMLPLAAAAIAALTARLSARRVLATMP